MDGGVVPMITTVDEVREVRRLVRELKQQLDSDSIPHGGIRLGLMVEVPVTALGIDLEATTLFLND